MFGLNGRLPAKQTSLFAAVFPVACAFVPSSQAATRGNIAQPPRLARNGAACTTGHFYDLVMPDGVNVVGSCPGTSTRVFADLEHLFGTPVVHNRLATPPARQVTAASSGGCVGGYRWVWMSNHDEQVPIGCS
jgi:hypothetical protein